MPPERRSPSRRVVLVVAAAVTAVAIGLVGFSVGSALAPPLVRLAV